jgi:hypothetical protein
MVIYEFSTLEIFIFRKGDRQEVNGQEKLYLP